MRDSFTDDLLAYRLPIHLVLDGARVVNHGGADIAERLTMHGLVGRPLFRETAHRPTVLAGPWLASLGRDSAALDQGVALARKVGKGEFWLGEPDSEVLFRHLRKLGAAMMPDGRILYFRYYDPDVLAAIAPLVDAEQAAYLFGPTDVIAFIGGRGDGATVVKPDGLPEPRSGPIAFEEWQIDSLDDRQRVLSRHRIADVLRQSFPENLNGKGDFDLLQDVVRHETDANLIGITSERGISQWAHLSIISEGRVNEDVNLHLFLQRDGPALTNDKLDTNYENLLIKCRAFAPMQR